MAFPRKTLRFVLAFAALALWLPAAHAVCPSELAFELAFHAQGPAPAQTAPCCAQRAAPILAENGRASAQGAGPSATTHLHSPRHAALERHSGRPDARIPWQRYCARSSRLLN